MAPSISAASPSRPSRRRTGSTRLTSWSEAGNCRSAGHGHACGATLGSELEASYWRASAVGSAAENAMWAYLTPHPIASGIAGHGAFDQRSVTIEAIPAPDREHTPHIVE